MPCTITDVLGYRSAAGTLVGLASQTISAIPSSPLLTFDYAGDFRPANGINPNATPGGPPTQYGVFTQTDGTGEWTLVLPYAATETKPASPLAKWSIVFPDGNALVGVVPSAAGPLSVDDLIASHGWTWANNVYVAPVTAGTFAKGTAPFSGGSATATILFAAPFAANSFQVQLTPSVDTNDGSIPGAGWATKTTSGFVITLDTADFVGSVDWSAQL